ENIVQKSCKKYKQRIKDLILSTEGFKYCRSYENEDEIFYSDRDKYLITEFNDIERTSGFIKSYHPDDTEIERKKKKVQEGSYEPKELVVEVEVIDEEN
ncbi:575_t:CDS:2, partial [Dentiscutata heterogama]